MRNPKTAVKITDVASMAGVAPMTVSRVLNAPERVAAETALRVRAAIDQLGYVPNLIAGGLSSRRSRMIAAVVPTVGSPMFAGAVQTFADTLEGAGYQVMLALSGYGTRDEDALLRSILARRPDGLLLTGAHRSPGARRMLADAEVPVVEIWDTNAEPTDMLVGFDHREVGVSVANHLLERGHDRFGALFASDARAGERRHGFTDTVRAAGGHVVSEIILPAPASIADGRRAMRQMIEAGLPERIALFCSSDLVAFGAVTEARSAGLDIPGRVAVCGFGDFELSGAGEPSITTVNVDGTRIGRTAAEFLLARLGGDDAPRLVALPFRIIPRASS